MDHIELWDKAKALMREELANVSYTTWIEQPLKPVYVVDDKLALEVISDFNEKTIRARYLPMITEAVSQAAGREMTIELMSVKERIEWQERQKKEDAPAMQGINMFNPKSTFDTFVVGSSNRFAHAAALAVAEQPGMAYNPLFLYGGVGLGKTHLMHAIGHFIQDHFPNMRMLYLPSEMFTNELVAAIKNNKNVEFRNRFRNVDVLMLDDIQFIAGRDSTQEEFFHPFNALHSAGKQIIISSDKPPREIARLEERLRSRFEWGLMVDVAPPDYETRLAIIRNKSAMLGVQLSDAVSDLIAENVTANVRQIEGTLNKILAYYDLMGSSMSQEDILKAIRDMIKKNNEYIPTAQAVVNYICSTYHIDEDVLRGQSRGREVVAARQIAMYLMRRIICMNLVDIGKEFGDRDHTTVLHSLDKVEKQMRSDPAFAETVKQITTNINTNPG